MNKKRILPLLMALTILMVGCKKMGPLTADFFTVTPSPLEAVGGQVDATITGKFPEKFFTKKAIVVVTPYIQWDGGKVEGAPYTYQGESVTGNNQSISFKAGGNITMKASFKYQPEMDKSELYLAFKVTEGKKSYDLPSVKVADGVISTSEIASVQEVSAAVAADKFQRIIKENYKANILFLIQQANVRADQLKTQEMTDLEGQINSTKDNASKELTGISISSYASPDGGIELNTELAEKREKATTKELQSRLNKNKINAELTGEFTAEDWAGFQELVEKSSIQDKDLILRVLSMYQDPEEREREIKNLSAAFKVLADEILPQLRYSRITATINLIGKSDVELLSLVKSNPSSLSVDELLYAASIAPAADKKAIYAKAAELYPSDYRAFNNVGMIEYRDGNLTEAANWFDKAAKASPNAAEVQMNLGLIALTKGDIAKAEQCLSKASGVSELNETLGTLYLKKGEYEKAVKSFGAIKSNNAGLAQLLTKDYSAAKNTLSAVAAPNATTYYLMALVGARTNNEAMVNNNLKQVAKMSPELKAKAAKDVEFAKFNVAAL